MEDIWKREEIKAQSIAMISSFKELVGRDLIATSGDLDRDTYALFHAPFALLSHGLEDDPILNYGNQTALTLWEMDFAHFTRMPSRLTAEPMVRGERQRLMEKAARQGYIDDYSGIRISASGTRFRITNVILWNVTNAKGTRLGQAAVFDQWDVV